MSLINKLLTALNNGMPNDLCAETSDLDICRAMWFLTNFSNIIVVFDISVLKQYKNCVVATTYTR